MASFCTVGQSAKVSWQFAGRSKRTVGFSKCPIDVSIGEGAGAYQGWPGIGRAPFGNITANGYRWENLDPAFKWEIRRISTGQIFSHQPRTCSIDGRLVLAGQPQGVYHIVPGAPIANGSVMILTGYDRFQLITFGGRSIVTGFKIDITDSTGYKLTDTGNSSPNYSVDCGGCGANALNCGGCCADCTKLKRKIEVINVRL